MKVLIIGSTGHTGLHLLTQGIQRGHGITAFTRRPNILKNIQGIKAIIHGDGLHVSEVRKGMENQDAVICSIAGNTKPDSIITDVIRNVTMAMQESGAQRILFISSSLIDAKRPIVVAQIVKWFLRHALADALQAEQLIKTQDLKWTIVRPSQLNDNPAKGDTRRTYGKTVNSALLPLPRADLASALLNSLENPKDIHQTYVIGGA